MLARTARVSCGRAFAVTSAEPFAAIEPPHDGRPASIRARRAPTRACTRERSQRMQARRGSAVRDGEGRTADGDDDRPRRGRAPRDGVHRGARRRAPAGRARRRVRARRRPGARTRRRRADDRRRPLRGRARRARRRRASSSRSSRASAGRCSSRRATTIRTRRARCTRATTGRPTCTSSPSRAWSACAARRRRDGLRLRPRARPNRRPFAGARFDARGARIALVHGSDEDRCPPGKRATAPFTLAEIGASGATCALAGHYHNGAVVRRRGVPRLAYPGSPEPIKFGERGSHGALVVTAERGRVGIEPVRWRARAWSTWSSRSRTRPASTPCSRGRARRWPPTAATTTCALRLHGTVAPGTRVDRELIADRCGARARRARGRSTRRSPPTTPRSRANRTCAAARWPICSRSPRAATPTRAPRCATRSPRSTDAEVRAVKLRALRVDGFGRLARPRRSRSAPGSTSWSGRTRPASRRSPRRSWRRCTGCSAAKKSAGARGPASAYATVLTYETADGAAGKCSASSTATRRACACTTRTATTPRRASARAARSYRARRTCASRSTCSCRPRACASARSR